MTATATLGQAALFATEDEAATTRLFARCPYCHRTVTVNVPAGEVNAAMYAGLRCRCGRTTRTIARIKASHHAGVRCDARCRNATGPDCECSCAGANHGIAHIFHGIAHIFHAELEEAE
jgi:hypothetical protein